MLTSILPAQLFALGLVGTSWLVLSLLLLGRSHKDAERSRRYDPTSFLGIALQNSGFAHVFCIRHHWWTSQGIPQISLVCITLILTLLAAIFIIPAGRTLGKQWSLSARILVDHQLITAGPYRFVRHPIYTGFLSLLVATCVVLSTVSASILAIMAYTIGTFIRIRREEKLLRKSFPAEYEAYASQVPRLIPRLRSSFHSDL